MSITDHDSRERRQYTIVLGSTTIELERKVNELIQQGWRCIGGVQVLQENGYSDRYGQSMEK